MNQQIQQNVNPNINTLYLFGAYGIGMVYYMLVLVYTVLTATVEFILCNHFVLTSF